MKRFWTTNAEAIAWVTLSTGIFSVIFASGKFAGDSASVAQINFLRQVGGFFALAIVVGLKGEMLKTYISKRPWIHFIRTLFGTLGSLAAIQAQADMPIVDATALGLLYVVFVLVLGMVFFHERIGRRQWAGILFCCAGAVTIMLARGAFQKFDTAYIQPAGLAVLGAVLFALEGTLIKHLANHDKPMVLLIQLNIFGMMLLAIPAWLTWKTLSFGEMILYLMLGPFGTFAQYCTIRGYRMADISVVGPVDYSWLIFASLIGFFFFQEVPTSGVWIGAALIAGGGIVLATVKPAREKQPVPELM